ncbi:DUF6300 family protein [Streptomyces sp. NPDC097610]|uniref:DUF6300 family protein n=1 Tax=Streptomyces sp. NPDC097610 TaxID=3157227 RepID=UPI00331E3915
MTAPAPKAENDEVHLQVDQVPPCTRCGGAALLRARFPYSWNNARGETVAGIREAELCPACDHGQPAADELLALFAVDDQLDLDNLAAFGGLVAAWVESVRHLTVDLQVLNDEHERWRRDEL